MNSRDEIIFDTIKDTIFLVEKSLNIKIELQIFQELFQLLNNHYLITNQSEEELFFHVETWGKSVWERLFFNHDNFKNLLILNYYETSNYNASPVLAPFPYKQLDQLGINSYKKILQLTDTNQKELCNQILEKLNIE